MLSDYTPSGKYNSRIFLGAPLVCVGAVVAGFIYQLLIHFIPLIYVDALLCLGFGFVLTILIGMLSRFSHCRNRTVGAAVGLLAAAVALGYAHWFEYRLMRTNASMDFFTYLRLRADAGWTIGRHGSGIPVSGVFAYLVWGVEACVILGAGILGGRHAANQPYCETCEKWADEHTMGATFVRPDPATVETTKTATEFEALLPAAGTPGPEGSSLLYQVESCPACKAFHTLEITHIKTVKKGKKTELQSDTVRKAVLISSAQVAELSAVNLSQIAAAAPTA